MSADERAREVEVRLVGEAIEDAAMRLKGRDLGTVHRDQIAREALDALEPVRAAERQEARADALEDAARRVRAVKNMPPGYTVDPARLLDELAENCRDRADGVTGRSET